MLKNPFWLIGQKGFYTKRKPFDFIITENQQHMTLNLNTATTEYTFTLYPIDTKFNRIAGIYIFLIIPPVAEALETVAEALEAPTTAVITQYSVLYAGITNNFRGRFNQHHKIEQAISLGMTHIGILKITSGRKRKKIEREILKHLHPPLNQTWLL